MGKRLEIILAGKDKTVKAFGSVQKRMAGLAKKAMSLQGAFVGLAGAAGLGALVKSSFDSIDQLAKTADKLGMTTEALAGLRHAAELTGVSQQKLDSSLERMSKRLGEAAMGGGAAAKMLENMGLSAEILIDKAPEQAFAIIADRINQMGTQSEKAAAAAAIFGREGVALVNTMAMGSEGLAKAAAEAEKFGVAISRADAAKIEAANDALLRAGEVVKGVGQSIAVELAPWVTKMATEFSEWASQGDNLKQVTEAVKTTFQMLGDSISTAVSVFGSINSAIDGTIKTIMDLEVKFEHWWAGFNKHAEGNANKVLVEFMGAGSAERPLSEKISEMTGLMNQFSSHVSSMRPSITVDTGAARAELASLQRAAQQSMRAAAGSGGSGGGGPSAGDVSSLKRAAAQSQRAASGEMAAEWETAEASVKHAQQAAKDAIGEVKKGIDDENESVAQWEERVLGHTQRAVQVSGRAAEASTKKADAVVQATHGKVKRLNIELSQSLEFWDAKIAEAQQMIESDLLYNKGAGKAMAFTQDRGYLRSLEKERAMAATAQERARFSGYSNAVSRQAEERRRIQEEERKRAWEQRTRERARASVRHGTGRQAEWQTYHSRLGVGANRAGHTLGMGAGSTTINVSPTYMTGDRRSGRAVAQQVADMLRRMRHRTA